MPSADHEALAALFEHRPSLAIDLLTDVFGQTVPEYRNVRLDSGKMTDLVPTEYRADVVARAQSADGSAALAVVVEVQLRPDRAKRLSWPVYLTTLRARLNCPVMLLVVSPDARTARWCAQPIELGHPGWLLTPLVLGPDMVPVVTDVDVARENPELAVLSALTHGRHPDRYPVLDALIVSLDIVDHEHASMYYDLVLAALPAAARRHLEEQMTTTREFKSDFMRKLVTTSEARGEARAVLTVLEARGIDVPAEIRSRIAECTDPVVLDAWVRAAVTVSSVDELFAADD